MKIVALTIAYNEALFISPCILSVLSQTLPVEEYVVVDDRSTDDTMKVVNIHPVKYVYIDEQGLPESHLNMVRAIIRGVEELTKSVPDWDVLLKVDADSVVPEDYVEKLLEHMSEDVGIASGAILGRNLPPMGASDGARIYRRECWDKIGGLKPVLGFDTHALIEARRQNWDTRCYDEVSYEELRSSRYTSKDRWRKAGKTRYLLGFPLLHSLLVIPIYLNDSVSGAFTLFLTHLYHIMKNTRKPFSDEYYRFANRYTIDSLIMRYQILFKRIGLYRKKKNDTLVCV